MPGNANDVDLSALKRSSISERFKVEFRASATNLFNRRQYVGGQVKEALRFAAAPLLFVYDFIPSANKSGCDKLRPTVASERS